MQKYREMGISCKNRTITLCECWLNGIRVEVEGVMLLGKFKSSIVYKPSISLSDTYKTVAFHLRLSIARNGVSDYFDGRRCHNFGYTDALSISWTTRAYRSRWQSRGYPGSSPCQSGASRRGGGSCRESSVRSIFLHARSGLSWIFETDIGQSSDVPQRISRISRAARSVRSRRSRGRHAGGGPSESRALGGLQSHSFLSTCRRESFPDL